MEKIQKLIMLMTKKNIDYCLISDPKAISYFVGTSFSPGERFLCLKVRNDGELVLYLNILFPYDETIRTHWYSDTDNPIADLVKDLRGTVAIDKNLAAHFLIELFDLSKDVHFINGTVIDEVKAIKDHDERRKMIKASMVNDEVMKEVAKLIEVGKSEEKLAEEIMQAFNRIGSEGESFPPIVAYQDHAADPHGMPGNRTLKEGEAVVVDMGCVIDGYCSDMTRTFFVGYNSEKEIYDLVLKANLAAEAMIKPGVRFKDIDKAARQVIEEAGYGQYFIHRLGHGIGMEVHEPFDVSATNDMIVEEGMCFSIEPGIYIKDRIGIRIEDLVLVTSDGVEVLNKYPKDQEVLIK